MWPVGSASAVAAIASKPSWAAYGPTYELTDLLAHLARDCRAAMERTGKKGCKGPYLPDLELGKRH